jgi:hypothetical protein
MSHNDFEEDDILMYCALRFDGYAYEAMRNHEGRRWSFPAVTEELENTMLFPEDDLECLAAFFAMQRYLGKWGGEYLTRVSREHILYRLLFLHCYRMDIPVGLRTHDWYPKWERVYQPERERCAAMIRQKMGRRMGGPEQGLAPSLLVR